MKPQSDHPDRNTDPTPIVRSDSSRSVVDRIEQLLKFRNEIASELHRIAVTASGSRYATKRIRSLGDWFQRPVTADQVLHNADALVICSFLFSGNDSDVQSRVRDAVRVSVSVDNFRQQSGNGLRLVPKLIYPIVLLLMVFAMCVIASFYLVPEFEKIFNEFGLDLPILTTFVLSLASSLRRWWMVGLIAVALLGLFTVVIVLPNRRLPPWTRWFRVESYGLRSAWATWAWHTGWLLKAGIDQSDAIAVAGSCSSESWLRRNSLQWADRMESDRQPFSRQLRRHWQPYGLLAYAFQLADRDDQVELLHAYAAIHRDQSRQRRLYHPRDHLAGCRSDLPVRHRAPFALGRPNSRTHLRRWKGLTLTSGGQRQVRFPRLAVLESFLIASAR